MGSRGTTEESIAALFILPPSALCFSHSEAQERGTQGEPESEQRSEDDGARTPGGTPLASLRRDRSLKTGHAASLKFMPLIEL